MSSGSSSSVAKAAATIAGECLGTRMRLLNRSVTTIYDDAFRPLGATSAQITILVATVRCASVSPAQLGRALNIEKSTLSRNLERLRKAGWIEISAEGRSQSISVTPAGSELVVEALPVWKGAQKAARKLLGSEGASQIHDIADNLKNQLAAP